MVGSMLLERGSFDVSCISCTFGYVNQEMISDIEARYGIN